MRSTYIAKPADVQRKWFVVDAEGQTLGRLAAEVAKILRGKHKTIYTPHVDTGDHVIIINAEKIQLTGNKENQKTYFRHSGYVKGDKLTPYKVLMAKRPEDILYHAVKGMLPKNVMGRQMFRKLNVYAGTEHPHQAQKPEALTFNNKEA